MTSSGNCLVDFAETTSAQWLRAVRFSDALSQATCYLGSKYLECLSRPVIKCCLLMTNSRVCSWNLHQVSAMSDASEKCCSSQPISLQM